MIENVSTVSLVVCEHLVDHLLSPRRLLEGDRIAVTAFVLTHDVVVSHASNAQASRVPITPHPAIPT